VSAPHVNALDLGSRSAHETALIAKDGSVWVAVSPAWWDLASWLWWWFSPADRRAIVILYTANEVAVRVRALRIARKSIALRGNFDGRR